MSQSPIRRGLMVLGMHRSGTSALARVFSLRGADLPATLMEANRGNPSGYWEPSPVVAFNDELLDHFGTRWDDPFAAFQLPDAGNFPRGLVARARALLADEYGDSALFVLKDPRNCVLGGFWSQVLAEEGIQACPVLVARPCADVAASLLRRDQTVPEASALLYVAYCVEAALQSAQSPTVLMYDDFLADWRGATDRVAREQGFAWPRRGHAADAEVAAFLHPVSHPAAALHASPAIQAWIDTVWDWYSACAAGERRDPEPLRAVRAQLAEAGQSFGPLLAARRQQVRELRATIAQDAAKAGEREALLQRTAGERDELMQQRDRLLALHERHRVDVVTEAQARADLVAERDRLAAQAEQQRRDAGERQRAYGELLEERDTLLGRFQEARAVSLQLEAASAGLEQARDEALAAWRGTDARLHETEQAFERLRAESARATAEIDRLRVQRDEAIGARDQATAGLEQLRFEHESLQVRLDDAGTRHATLLDERDALAARQAGLAAERDALLEVRDRLVAERDDVLALTGQRQADLEQARELLERAETALAQSARELQRTQRELDHTRSEMRRAQDGLSQVHSSRSWRITAPLRSVATAGRNILAVSRNGLHRPKRLLQLAPPEAATPAAPAAEPAFTRRKHPQLRAFLDAEFGSDAARDTLLRIDRHRLPVDLGEHRAAATVTCTDDEARAWVEAIAARAASHPPVDDTPDVSIVVPVYNQLPFTLACLDALFAQDTRYRFEVLVGDDASTDGTHRAFERPIAGVHYLRHADNLGFVRNCNETARLARGRYVVMLNNDALVLPGWLDELIGVLESNPAVGLVGSKLIYPDGRLQECGGIVWRDGSAWNFGRLDDPRRPEHNYLRGADFVSGASIAVPTALWRRLGGFDELFVPAYAEDVDLAFRVRAAGLYTLVQPLSQVLHFEGISAGTDLGQGMKAHQVGNLRKLHERWRGRLALHRENGQVPELEKERDVSRRLLFIDHTTLTPNEDAGSLVAFEIMTSLRRHGYKVTFIPEDNFAHMGEDTRVLQRLGVETIYHPSYSRMEQFLAARHDPFDVVVMHRFTVGDRHLAELRAAYPQARFVFIACDLHFLREQREADLSNDAGARQRAERTRQRELAVIERSDAVVVYSEAEEEIVRAALPQAQVALVPLVHDPVAQPTPLSQREGVCFVGGYRHAPNADAIRWFVDQVWPLVHVRCPQAVLHVAGSHMPEAVKALGHRPGVEITGFVPDMEGFLSRRRVNVAPLRFGAGVKGKVAASLANGLPTVGTHIAAEGMQLSPGEDILVADDPAAFAEHVVQLLTDDARWQAVSEAGLRYAATITSRASAHARIGALLARLDLPAQP